MSEIPTLSREKRNKMKRRSAIVGAGLIAGLIAAAIGGVASAQTVVTEVSEPSAVIQQVVGSASVTGVIQTEEGPEFFDELSPEDEAVFEEYDQCLVDAGVDINLDDEVDESAIDAAFEQCEPILDDLSEDFDVEFDDFFDELSPEDEAIFDEYDQCLEDGGIDAHFENEDIDEAAIDAVFESCDPLLDGLSEDAQALFDNFDDCDDEEDDDF